MIDFNTKDNTLTKLQGYNTEYQCQHNNMKSMIK